MKSQPFFLPDRKSQAFSYQIENVEKFYFQTDIHL